MTQEELVSEFSNKFANRFNTSIRDLRREDDIVGFIDEVCRECEKMIPLNIKYRGFYFDDSFNTNNTLAEYNSGLKNVKKNTVVLHCKETLARLCVFEFDLKLESERKEGPITEKSRVKMPIWIPLLYDDYHYYIKGNKYSPPIQIIDRIIYANQSDMIILKTMSRPIKMTKTKGTSIVDIYGNKYLTQTFHIYISKKKIPFLLFYLAYFNFNGTLDFFNAKDHIKLVNIKNIYDISEEQNLKYLYFKFGQCYLQIDRAGFEGNLQVRQFVASLLSVVKKSMDANYIHNIERWQAVLGSYINDINAIEKGNGLVKTFVNALDFRTKDLIRDLIPDGDKKQDTHSMIRYMFMEFSNLSSRKITDMGNKRLRLGEYLISPIIKAMQYKIYRFLNINKKNRSIKHLEDIFKISSQVLLNCMIGKITKKELALNIMKYSSYTNDNALLNSATRAVTNGPGSPAQNSGKHISVDHRQFDETSLGKICTIYASASDPGVSLMMVPMALIDKEKKIFIDEDCSQYLQQ